MAITERRLTLDEFLALPEEKPALEFRHGQVTQKVAPDRTHSMLQTLLPEHINRFARPRELAMAFTELRAVFGEQGLVPDVSVYRWDQIPFDDDDRVVGGEGDPPAIAIEIVSPGQSVTELVEKCLGFLDSGTEIALVIDAKVDTILDIRIGGHVRALRGADRIDLSSVLPGFELTVDDVFALLQRPTPDRPAAPRE